MIQMAFGLEQKHLMKIFKLQVFNSIMDSKVQFIEASLDLPQPCYDLNMLFMPTVML